MKKLLIIIGAVVCIALGFGLSRWVERCTHREDEPAWELTDENRAFIDRMVSVYDAFVRSRTSDTIPIDEAYGTFFANLPEIESAGDMGVVIADSIYTFDLMHEIISGRWEYGGLFEAQYHGPMRGLPAHWSIHPVYPEMLNFLKNTAKESPFLNAVADSFAVAGDFSPTIVSGLLYSCDEIDFGNEMERFVVASILFPEGVNDDSFVLPIDKTKNDSLKTVWNNDNQRTN